MKPRTYGDRIKATGVATLLLSGASAMAGTLDPEQGDWHQRYQKQENAPLPAEMLLNEDPEPQLDEGFVDLFNGRDLSGWRLRGGKAKFEVVDGAIVGTAVPGTPSSYLCTEREDYSDFLFTCEVKWDVDLNSGVMFRAAVRDKNGLDEVFGPQAEMEGVRGDRGWSGGIYGQSCGGYFYPLWLKEHRAARGAIRADGWNRLTLEAKGNVVKTWINGVPASHWVDDGTYTAGFFALQVHKANRGKVRFRDLRMKETRP